MFAFCSSLQKNPAQRERELKALIFKKKDFRVKTKKYYMHTRNVLIFELHYIRIYSLFYIIK